jgi:excisionase family DNA binding protein
MDEILYSVKQIGKLLSVHPLTVRRYIKDGKLKAIRIAGNIRIPKSYLDGFSEDFQATKHAVNATVNTHHIKEFRSDDAMFKLKGKGVSVRAI